MKRIWIILIFLLGTGCTTIIENYRESTSSSTEFIPTITSTATSTPEPTPTMTPIEGTLFFDLNGSGLRDEASFVYDSKRLSDDRQPLQPDLQIEIRRYLTNHPETIEGDLITISEPGLSMFSICNEESCTLTDENGRYSLKPSVTNRKLRVTDPNIGNPAFEMKYVNIWKGKIRIPEYSIKIPEGNISIQLIIPYCENDTLSLVCKKDIETLIVREQILNDANSRSLDEEISIVELKQNDIGLMQGFLTSPLDYKKGIWLWTFSDLNFYIGSVENYLGETNQPDYYQKVTGTGDQHQGIDWETSIGDLLFASANGKVIDVWDGINNEAKSLRVLSQPGGENGYVLDFAHNSVNLIQLNQRVYRGQIVGLSGKSGVEIPHLHLSTWQVPNNVNDNGYVYYQIFENPDYPKVMYGDGSLVPAVFDSFRKLSDENAFSLWTVDNLIFYYQ